MPLTYQIFSLVLFRVFQVGARLSSGSILRTFDGLIDDVGIFDRELSSVEVSDIKTNGMEGAVVTAALPQLLLFND